MLRFFRVHAIGSLTSSCSSWKSGRRDAVKPIVTLYVNPRMFRYDVRDAIVRRFSVTMLDDYVCACLVRDGKGGGSPCKLLITSQPVLLEPVPAPQSCSCNRELGLSLLLIRLNDW